MAGQLSSYRMTNISRIMTPSTPQCSPSMRPAHPTSTPPPMRPIVKSWLEDEVPRFLPLGTFAAGAKNCEAHSESSNTFFLVSPESVAGSQQSATNDDDLSIPQAPIVNLRMRRESSSPFLTVRPMPQLWTPVLSSSEIQYNPITEDGPRPTFSKIRRNECELPVADYDAKKRKIINRTPSRGVICA